jgi:hypothetical protein
MRVYSFSTPPPHQQHHPVISLRTHRKRCTEVTEWSCWCGKQLPHAPIHTNRYNIMPLAAVWQHPGRLSGTWTCSGDDTPFRRCRMGPALPHWVRHACSMPCVECGPRLHRCLLTLTPSGTPGVSNGVARWCPPCSHFERIPVHLAQHECVQPQHASTTPAAPPGDLPVHAWARKGSTRRICWCGGQE